MRTKTTAARLWGPLLLATACATPAGKPDVDVCAPCSVTGPANGCTPDKCVRAAALGKAGDE